jgi:hypothetical protein
MALLDHRNTATTKKLDFKNTHLTSVGANYAAFIEPIVYIFMIYIRGMSKTKSIKKSFFGLNPLPLTMRAVFFPTGVGFVLSDPPLGVYMQQNNETLHTNFRILVKVVSKVTSPPIEGLMEDKGRMAQNIIVKSFFNKIWFGLRCNPFGFTRRLGPISRAAIQVASVTCGAFQARGR